MTTEQTVARPTSVTVVVVLTWIAALVSIVSGIVALLLTADELTSAGVSEQSATVFGWAAIIVGAVAALVALGLGRGSSLARNLVSLLMVVRMSLALWAMLTLPEAIVPGVITFAVALLVLYLLWNGRASAYFAAE